jgi:hypothetical protein
MLTDEIQGIKVVERSGLFRAEKFGSVNIALNRVLLGNMILSQELIKFKGYQVSSSKLEAHQMKL